MKVPASVRQVLLSVVGLLVKGEYEALERMTRGRHVRAEEMAMAISQYGRTLKTPPPDAYEGDLPHAREGEWQGRHAYFVGCPLWTVEEGESDLELDLVLVDAGDESYDVELNDIRVP